MTREIKFRAWDKEENEMFNASSGFNDFTVGIKVESVEHTMTVSSKKYELMQFTGLLDKNGKEIYEGDVVKDDNGGDEELGIQIGKVMWNHEWCSFRWNDGDDWSLHSELEVVGNIYENPELISNIEEV